MLRMILFVWASYVLMPMAYSQNYTVSATPPPTDIDAQISFALSDIDFTPITSGMLKDKTTLMGHPHLYGPSSVQDSQYTSMSLVHYQYLSLHGGKLSTATIATPEADYRTVWSAHDPTATTIPM